MDFQSNGKDHETSRLRNWKTKRPRGAITGDRNFKIWSLDFQSQNGNEVLRNKTADSKRRKVNGERSPVNSKRWTLYEEHKTRCEPGQEEKATRSVFEALNLQLICNHFGSLKLRNCSIWMDPVDARVEFSLKSSPESSRNPVRNPVTGLEGNLLKQRNNVKLRALNDDK